MGGFGYDKIFKLKGGNKYYSELTTKDLLEVGGRQLAVKELILKSDFLKL